MYDITTTICLTSYTIHKVSHLHFMTSHHIIYDITCSVLVNITHSISGIASTVSVSPQPLYLWSLANCMYDITPTLYMTSYAPYIMSHPLFMTYHHCSHHIASTVFLTSHTLYMTSHTWQHKRYICHHTHYIWHYIQCICVIKPTVSIITHPVSGWHQTHYMGASYAVCKA